MEIEFDPAKDARNLAKHGMSLARAAEMFDAPTSRFVDERKDYGEARMICFGLIDDRVHCCVYTDRKNVRRIISLRKANKDEINAYFSDIR